MPQSSPFTPQLDASEVISVLGASDARHLGNGSYAETWFVSGLAVNGEHGGFAVKLLEPSKNDPRRVQREVESLTAVAAPGVVRLHEARLISLRGESCYALIFENVSGGDLGVNLRTGRPTVDLVVEFATALFENLAVLHAANVVHRDIKPANLILRDGEWGRPVLLDFGLAKGLFDATITLYPNRVGSPWWMSPEQLAGERASKQSDVWSCGVVIYDLLALGHPYFAPNPIDIQDLLDQVAGPAKPLPATVPAAISDEVLKLVSFDAFARGSAKRAARVFASLKNDGEMA